MDPGVLALINTFRANKSIERGKTAVTPSEKPALGNVNLGDVRAKLCSQWPDRHVVLVSIDPYKERVIYCTSGRRRGIPFEELGYIMVEGQYVPYIPSNYVPQLELMH